MPTNSIFLHYFFKGINSLWGLSLSCNFIQNSHQQIACVIDYNPFPQSLPLEAGVQPMVFWIPAGPISYHPLPSLHGSYDNTAGHFYTMKVPIAFFFEIHSVRGKKQSWHLNSLEEIIASFCNVSSLGQWRTVYMNFTQGPKMTDSEPTRTISHCHGRQQKKVHISPRVNPIISAHISLTDTVMGPNLSSRGWKSKVYVSRKHANILKQH